MGGFYRGLMSEARSRCGWLCWSESCCPGRPRLGDEPARQRGVLALNLPVATADEPKYCCRTCRKGKPNGNGCISAEKRCRAGLVVHRRDARVVIAVDP